MNPPEDMPPLHGSAVPSRQAAPAPQRALARQWLALHRAAHAVASLAGEPAPPLDDEASTFPERVEDAGGWLLNLARQGIADLAAVMEPGLNALIAVHARGADPAVPARALLGEFVAARAALLGLLAEDR